MQLLPKFLVERDMHGIVIEAHNCFSLSSNILLLFHSGGDHRVKTEITYFEGSRFDAYLDLGAVWLTTLTTDLYSMASEVEWSPELPGMHLSLGSV